MNLNEHYLRLSDTDPLSVIEKKVSNYCLLHPENDLIRLDIEDSLAPLPLCVEKAMEQAAHKAKNDATLRQVPPVNGYPFLIEEIRKYYEQKDVVLNETEIFVSNGAKADIAGITELFSHENTVLIPEPFSPIYYNSNLAGGRNVRFISTGENASLLPSPDENHADIIYLSSPCNPTGEVYSRELLQQWVDYALFHNALILFDASYESFIRNNALARSIYEIDGAKKCAVEICSLSKSAGFANSRLGYTVIPNPLIMDSVRLNQLWTRRIRLKFNGVPYVIQKGAQAVFSPEGQKEIAQTIDKILFNAQLLKRAFVQLDLCSDGNCHSPNVWIRCPRNMSSWECFDYFLNEAQIVMLPGSIYGARGENHMKLTGYSSREDTLRAISRIAALLAKEKENE